MRINDDHYRTAITGFCVMKRKPPQGVLSNTTNAIKLAEDSYLEFVEEQRGQKKDSPPKGRIQAQGVRKDTSIPRQSGSLIHTKAS